MRAVRSGASSTARSRPTSAWASITCGVERSRTSSSGTRRCAASASGTRTATTARGCGSRSASSASSASTRSGRSRSTGSPSSPAAAARRWPGRRRRSPSSRSGSGVDGLGERLLHVLGHEHRVHLALPRARPRAGLARARPSLHRVVPPVRNVDLPARAVPGYYFEKTDPSLFVRFPLKGRDGEALVVWTTTPWTLPANVAAAVQPDADYGLLENGDWVAPPATRTDVRARRAGIRARRLPSTRGRSTICRRSRSHAPRDPVGRGVTRGGERDRPHRARVRHGGLRALEGPRPAGTHAGRRGRALLWRLRLAAWAIHRRREGSDHRRSARARPAGRGGRDPTTATRSAGAARRR